MASSLASILFRGTSSFFFGSFGSALIAFLLNILFARIFAEDLFGLLVLILSVLASFQIFSELGISIAIVQKKNLQDILRDNAFYLSFSLSIFLSILMICKAEWLAELLNQPTLVNYIYFLVPILILRSVYSVYRGILLRSLKYRSIAVIEFFAYLLYASVAIILVFLDFELDAVLIGQIISATFLLLVAIKLSGVLPRSSISFHAWRELAGFGGLVALNRVLGSAAGYFDRFLLAALMPTASLGGYFLAQQLANFGPGLITGSIEQTTLPIYSKNQDNLEKLESQYIRSVKVAMVFTFPLIIIPAAHAEVLFSVIYGERWIFAVELYQIFAGFAFVGAMGGGLFASLMYSTGRTKEILLTGLFRSVVLPLCVLIGSISGPIGIAWGVFVFGVIGRVFNQWVLSYALGFSMTKFFVAIWRLPALAILISMLAWNSSNSFIEALIFSALQFLAWLIAIFLFSKQEFYFVRAQFLSSLSFRMSR